MSRGNFGERSFAGEQEQRGYGQGAGGYAQQFGRPQFGQGQSGQGQFGQGPYGQGQYGPEQYGGQYGQFQPVQGQYGGQGQLEQRGWQQGQQGFGQDPRFSQESQFNYPQQGNWGQQEQRAAQQGQPGQGQIPMIQPGAQQGYGAALQQGNYPQAQGNGGRGLYGQFARNQGDLARAAEFAQSNYGREVMGYGPAALQARQAGPQEYGGQFAQRPAWGQLQQDWREAQRYWGQGGQNWAQGAMPGQQWIRGPFAGRGPKGYKRSDERINEDVSDRLAQHSDIDASDIEVRVSNSEVTLAGTVDSRWTKRLAEDLAEDVPGVREIHNQLRVQQPTFAQQAPQQAATERGRQTEREPSRQAQAAGRS